MSENDTRALELMDDVLKTADRLARKMGGAFTLNEKWKDAAARRDEQKAVAPNDLSSTLNRF